MAWKIIYNIYNIYTSMEGENMICNYHHSSHGLTTLHNLLIDKDRPQKIILLKYGISPGESSDDLVDLSYNEILKQSISVLSEQGVRDLFEKHKEEMESIPFIDHIQKIPNGLEVEINLLIRGEQGQSVEAHDFTSDPQSEPFPEDEYFNYIKVRARGNEKNVGIIYNVTVYKDGQEHIFLDLERGIVINLPNIEYDYEADFNVGLLELIRDDDEELIPVGDDSGDIIKYSGFSFDIEYVAYFHSYSPETEDISLINGLINGSGNNNWNPEIYKQYQGCKREIGRETKKIIVNVFGSNCLNAQEFEEHGNIGNVIPFMMDATPEWGHLFHDHLIRGADEEIEHQEGEVVEERGKLDGIQDKINEARVMLFIANSPGNVEESIWDRDCLIPHVEYQRGPILARTRQKYHKLIEEIETELEYFEEREKDSKYALREKKKRVEKAKKVHKAVKSIKKQSLGPMKEGKRERKKRK
tara:strand:- start:1198 stop:2610 length:1413 start_codon:yes stop_codon:yes gene_type:complete